MGIVASNITADSAQLLVAQCESGSDYFRIAKASVSKRIIGNFGSSSVTDNNTTGVNKFTARINKSGLYVNGSRIGTFSNVPSSFSGIGAVDIFRGKYSDTAYYAYPGSRLHSAWVDDNVFLPCRRNSDNQLGIYNTKTGQFILPSGSGTFTAGPDVVPSPDTPMDIVCNNGVLKFGENIVDNTIDGAGTFISPSSVTTRIYKAFGKLPSGNYKLTITGNFEFIVQYKDAMTNPTASGNIGSWSTSGEYTLDNPDYYYGIAIRYPNNATISPSNFNGTISLRPLYIHTDGTQEVVIDSLGNTANAERLLAVGDYKDTQEVISGSVTRKLGIAVLDGTETWNKSSTYTGSFYANNFNPSYGAKVADNSNVYCTHGFKVNNLSEYSSASIGAIYWYSSTTINYKYDDGTATVAQFKQWLTDQYNAGTPVIIVYPLATAGTSTVTGQFLSKSPVTQTAGSISGLPIAITESEKTTPTPQQPLDINCNNGVVKVSKNLFDYVKFYDNYQTVVGSGVGRYPIKLKPNTQYTVSCNFQLSETSSLIFAVSGNSTSWTPSTQNNGILSNSSRTVTTDTNGYLCFGMYISGANAVPEGDFVDGSKWVQLEKGSTATPYRPYVEGSIYTDGTTETVEIDTTGDTATAENLFKVGTYQDVQSVIDGGVTRNVGILVLDGTEGWTYESQYSRFYAELLPVSIIQPSARSIPAYCSHFKMLSNGEVFADITSGQGYISRTNQSNSRVYLHSDITTVEGFKQFLADQYNAGQPVVIIYPLATPTTETVTGQPMNIQEGTNIVQITQASMDGLELEVKYKAGVEVTIEEIENANLDSNVEVTISG